MVVATRPINWRTLDSRSGVPFLPWKYLEATMFVAVMDQAFGTSTSFCSKMTSPDSLVMAAVRYSHSTVSYGEMPSRVKYRRNSSPFCAFVRVAFPSAFVSRTSSFIARSLPILCSFSTIPQDTVVLGQDRSYLTIGH